MEIVKKLVKWRGFKRTQPISEIVVHGTGGAGTLNYVLNGGRIAEYEKGIGLFHFLIGLDGKIYQLLELDRWCYHSTSGKHDEKTVGIEIEKRSVNNSDEPSPEQYKNLNALVGFLKCNFPIEKIVSHDHNARVFSKRAPKPCCGTIDLSKLDFSIDL